MKKFTLALVLGFSLLSVACVDETTTAADSEAALTCEQAHSAALTCAEQELVCDSEVIDLLASGECPQSGEKADTNYRRYWVCLDGTVAFRISDCDGLGVN